jgi:hypothetical protein
MIAFNFKLILLVDLFITVDGICNSFSPVVGQFRKPD